MARRRRSRGKPIELFPFLAILACVIGVLTLMIAGLSMGEIELDTSGSDYVILQRAIAADQARIGELSRREEDGRIRGARVRHARTELARRETLGEKNAELEQQTAALDTSVAEARKNRDALAESLATMQQELAAIENKLKGRRAATPPKGSVELGAPRARAGQVALSARFVECRKNEIVLHPDKPRNQQVVVAKAQMITSGAFSRLRTEVKARSDRTVILLVREGGVLTHDRASAILTALKVRHGSLPVPGALRIDFSKLKAGGR